MLICLLLIILITCICWPHFNEQNLSGPFGVTVCVDQGEIRKKKSSDWNCWNFLIGGLFYMGYNVLEMIQNEGLFAERKKKQI